VENVNTIYRTLRPDVPRVTVMMERIECMLAGGDANPSVEEYIGRKNRLTAWKAHGYGLRASGD